VNRLEIPSEIPYADRRKIELLVRFGVASLQAAINTWYHARGRNAPREEQPEPEQQDASEDPSDEWWQK
jgi:hypothetical protein